MTYICVSAACQVSPPIWVLPLRWACRWKQSDSLTSPSQPGFSLCDPSAELCLCCVDEWKPMQVIPLRCIPPLESTALLLSCSSALWKLRALRAMSLSALPWWGEAYIFPLNATWKEGEEGLQPTNGDVLSDLETSSPTSVWLPPAASHSFCRLL